MRTSIGPRHGRVAVLLVASLALAGCSDSPTPVGATLLGPTDKIAFHTLDSAVPGDSITFDVSQRLRAQSSVAARTMLLGLAPGVEARALVRFGLNVDSAFVALIPDTIRLHDCYLQIPLASYRFGDTSGALHLAAEVHEVLPDFGTGATWDSLGATSTYSPTVLGTLDTTVGRTDSLLRIRLDTSFVLRLLRYVHFDTLNTYFHGLVLVPRAGTTGVVALQNGNVQVRGVITHDTVNTDTMLLSSVVHLFISSSTDVDPPGELVARMGLPDLLYLVPHLPALPRLSALNSVQLELTLDSARSAFGEDHRMDSLGQSTRDTVLLTIAASDTTLGTVTAVGARVPGTTRYVFAAARAFVDAWRHGAPQRGMTVVQSLAGAGSTMSTLDRFVFYGFGADSTTRPRMRVTYSTLGP